MYLDKDTMVAKATRFSVQVNGSFTMMRDTGTGGVLISSTVMPDDATAGILVDAVQFKALQAAAAANPAFQPTTVKAEILDTGLVAWAEGDQVFVQKTGARDDELVYDVLAAWPGLWDALRDGTEPASGSVKDLAAI